MIQELLVTEVAGSQAWKQPAQNTQKAAVTSLLQVLRGLTSKHWKKESLQLKNT